MPERPKRLNLIDCISMPCGTAITFLSAAPLMMPSFPEYRHVQVVYGRGVAIQTLEWRG